MCIKPKHWHDLVTDEAFTRADIIVLQDPLKAREAPTSVDYLSKDVQLDGEDEVSPIVCLPWNCNSYYTPPAATIAAMDFAAATDTASAMLC